MTDTQLFEKLEKTYASDGGKKFISHLLRSFFPPEKSQYIWEKKAVPVKCCLTNQVLTSKEEIMEMMLGTSQEEVLEYLKSSLDPESFKVEHPVKKKLGNKVLGIECKDSDKLLSKQAFEQLYNFYATKILKNDSHMKWLAKNMMAKSTVEAVKEKTSVSKSEETAIHRVMEKPKKATFGDLDALQALKTRLENEEKKKGS